MTYHNTDHSSGSVYLVHPVLKKESNERSLERECEELEGLAQAIHLKVLDTKIISLNKIVPSTYLGKGVCEDFKESFKDLEPDLVIVNAQLSPVQQRNLERLWSCKVIDRTGLILEIFGERAQTKEGRIQVELAALNYQRSRLVRSWTHLERQRGGAGFMGGPGERQIEIDRRLIDEKIISLKKQLEKVRQNRDLQRKNRDKVPYPVVALVGYTNAGKSTLFNYLTDSNVFAEDLLFATLDPTMRALTLPNGREAILSDTVGFITDLPTQLVEAFRATLEQVLYADVVVHVRDYVAEDSEQQKDNVISILKDLGITYQEDERVIEVLNKIDLLEKGARQLPQKREQIVPVSAATGENTDKLLSIIEKTLMRSAKEFEIDIPFKDGKALAWLHAHGDVRSQDENHKNNMTVVKILMENAQIEKFESLFGYKT